LEKNENQNKTTLGKGNNTQNEVKPQVNNSISGDKPTNSETKADSKPASNNKAQGKAQ